MSECRSQSLSKSLPVSSEPSMHWTAFIAEATLGPRADISVAGGVEFLDLNFSLLLSVQLTSSCRPSTQIESDLVAE